jgi:hypothetical protein
MTTWNVTSHGFQAIYQTSDSESDVITLDVWLMQDGVTYVCLINDVPQNAIAPTTDLAAAQAAVLAAAATWLPP